MKLLFAGDWHGDEDWAEEVLTTAATQGVEWVVQVGDSGFGFYRLGEDPAEPGDWAPGVDERLEAGPVIPSDARIEAAQARHDQ